MQWQRKITQRRDSEKGMALLTVLVALMLLFLMTYELQYSASIERKLAYNDLNHLQAYYLAKSGANMGLIRLALYAKALKDPTVKSLLSAANPTPPGQSSSQSSNNNNQYLDVIWQLPVPPFPLDEASRAVIGSQDKSATDKEMEETRVSIGQTTHVITSESAKINLNFFNFKKVDPTKPLQCEPSSTPTTLVDYNCKLLRNLIEGFIKESPNANEEYGNLKPLDVIFNIIDWTLTGEESFMGGAKDSWYQQQKPPYKAKRGPFFTIDELRMVKDIDGHLFQKLKPHITVYSQEGQINLNEASNTMLRALYPDFTDDDLKKIAEQKAEIQQWTSTQQFIDFVSGTLSRPGFKTLYNDPNNLPFTINTRSFLIEAQGVIRRSKSQVQSTIRVAAALTVSRTGGVDKSATDAAGCKLPNLWLDTLQKCMAPPQTGSAEECQADYFSSTIKQGNQDCCNLSLGNGQTRPFCPVQSKDGKAPDPNALQIMSWLES